MKTQNDIGIWAPNQVLGVTQTLTPIVMVPAAETTGTESPIRVERVDVDIRIHGFVADTTMTLVFYNPNDRVLAGDLYFPLPEGATVSGFALDVAGSHGGRGARGEGKGPHRLREDRTCGH